MRSACWQLPAECDARDLGLFRLLFCATAALTLLLVPEPAGPTVELLASHPEAFRPIRAFAALGIGPMPASAYVALRWALIAALCLAAAGVLTRAALLFSTAGFFLYFGTAFSALKPAAMDVNGHLTEPAFWTLAILACAPGVGAWGLAGMCVRKESRPAPRLVPAWPLHAVRLLLGLIYLGAAYGKLQVSWAWGDGVGLAQTLARVSLLTDGAPAWELAQRPWACAALAAACLLFEATFWLVVPFPRLGPVFAMTGLAMHAALRVLLGFNYFLFFIDAYWVFFPWSAVRAALRRIGASPSPAAVPSARPLGRGPAAALAAFAAVNLACMAAKTAPWPLSDWRFHPHRWKSGADAPVYRLAWAHPDGRLRWLARAELPTPAIAVSNGFEQAVRRRDARWLLTRMDLIRRLAEARAPAPGALMLVKRWVVEGKDGALSIRDAPLAALRAESALTPALSRRR